jgi:hypothetical protein
MKMKEHEEWEREQADYVYGQDEGDPFASAAEEKVHTSDKLDDEEFNAQSMFLSGGSSYVGVQSPY